MKRWLSAAFVVVFCVGAWAAVVVAADELDGSYIVTGKNPDGKAYEGTATVTKLEQTYSIQWQFDGELAAVGVGIRKGNTLAVIFQTRAGQVGLSLYVITKNRLEGTWTAPGADVVTVETLTKTNAAVRAAPKPKRPSRPRVEAHERTNAETNTL